MYNLDLIMYTLFTCFTNELDLTVVVTTQKTTETTYQHNKNTWTPVFVKNNNTNNDNNKERKEEKHLCKKIATLSETLRLLT